MHGMNIDAPTPLLGGLTPRQFMRRHWQKRPLLIRQALPGVAPPVTRSELFALAGNEGVESRLVEHGDAGWVLRHGPLSRRAIPGVKRPNWTLLVQGLDLHVDAAHELLAKFRFVPDARLDDLMLSYATEGGGVGPHLDSYDVFLLQVHGAREWRIGRVAKPRFAADAPLKILTNFRAEQRWLLEPGDMLYLPPLWAHEGVARGECMTASIGFRAPARRELAGTLMQRWLDDVDPADPPEAARAPRYRDREQDATAAPGRIPAALSEFAAAALRRELADPRRLGRVLGELLSEPKHHVVFTRGPGLRRGRGLRLDRRSRMLYDARHVFINGESFNASGSDAALLRRLADRQCLEPNDVARFSPQAKALIDDWARCGWLLASCGGARRNR
jgi:50S ribosomal protein L16 3-hydroxylase